MSVTFTIFGRLAGMNELIAANRAHRMKGAQLKKLNTEVCRWEITRQKVPIFTKPIHIHIKWIEPNAKRDIDNVAAGIKFLLDSLQMAGCISNDNRQMVKRISHEFPDPDKTNPRIEVTIEEII